MYDKINFLNKAQISNCEILDYILEGILDETPHDRAFMQKFNLTQSLVSAFEKIT